ncbi:MAG: phosphatidylserine decarboxylase family protein [Chitinophagales bacterium]|jgi:phosphatidylserine decarboxylase|nr:phosphatidylserine decarboxylase family protein [Bacteroidota bacterium]MBK7566476.1 phosphatidylserine decarboxylase family protein [Bacteroidota bacterium]MBP8917127.1 phosphatidylserine decarboxylase family protein [Chitinophagales bacterium]MBP9221694.1 phosphatidylserine decarboxylase family protein [Chitinophagales bacterium]MBP9795524.1 phosphatidylserine decarboxylase family protein [Chitinophagales bacterium]
MLKLIHREGRKIIIAFLVFLVLLNFSIHYFFPEERLLHALLLIASLGGILFVMMFFRNPKRRLFIEEGAIIAPADGKVVVVEETTEGEYFKDRRLQISIFMSVKNVHINRNPISGQVKYFKYHPGKYLLAWNPKSSTDNERTTFVIEDEDDNVEIMMRQIAGTVARRIKFYVEEGDEVTQGSEIGFIKFGSRVDLYLPLDSKVEVKIGEKVKGGQTVIARVVRNK